MTTISNTMLTELHRSAEQSIGDAVENALITLQDSTLFALLHLDAAVPELVRLALRPAIVEAGRSGVYPWYLLAAVDAIQRGHYHAIRTRDRQSLYLLRCWLTTPKELPAAEQSDGHRWDSADSVLLHFFARGDDDESLHDHPWDFTTRILAGGYVEHLPPSDYVHIPGYGDGPAWNEFTVNRVVGDCIEHYAKDLHCVGSVQPGTWSLVTTHDKHRVWGFHPPGRPWIQWDAYLDERRALVQEVQS